MSTQLETEYVLLSDLNDVLGMFEAYISRPTIPVAFDTETTGLEFYQHKMITFQFMQFGYTPVILDVRQWSKGTLRHLGKYLQELFDTCKIVGMNLSFDYKFVRRWTGAKIGRAYDVMLADQVIYGLGHTGGRKKGIEFNLLSIANRYGYPMSKEERSVFPEMDQRPDEWNAPLSAETLTYCAKDVDVLETIYRAQLPKVKQLELGHVLQLENRAMPAVASIEYNGIMIDQKGWRAIISEKEKEAAEYEKQAIEVFGAAIVKCRARKFRKLMRNHKQWQAALDAELARVKAEFEATGETKGWADFKNSRMRAWRKDFPNPGIPKLQSHSPYAEWLLARDKAMDTARNNWVAGMKEMEAQYGSFSAIPDGELERWKQDDVVDQFMRVWDRDHPMPEPDGYLDGLHKSRNLCYEPINLGSVPQMLEAFQELKIPLTSTSQEALDDLPDGMYPEVDLLKAWRAAQMFPTKFGESLLSLIHPKTGRIYQHIIQIGADTGRSSVTNPPWQQIPSKTEDGKRLRKCVVPAPGNWLFTFDYPNIELRIIADMAKDKRMLEWFATGKDLHTETAKLMFGLNETFQPKKDRHKSGVLYRQIAKTINFGLIYGMSAMRLAHTLKISKEEAKELMNTYFALFPGVVAWLKQQRVLGPTRMWSRTLAGRKRFYSDLPDKYHPDYNKNKSYIERQACNSPIQGSSADITKLALALCYERLPEAAKIVAVVHDEIVVEAPKELEHQVYQIIAESMKESCTKYLKNVFIPDFDGVVGVCWEKE